MVLALGVERQHLRVPVVDPGWIYIIDDEDRRSIKLLATVKFVPSFVSSWCLLCQMEAPVLLARKCINLKTKPVIFSSDLISALALFFVYCRGLLQ